MRMGRSRTRQAVITASRTSTPSSIRRRANSTMRMLSDMVMPASMTTPMRDITFNVVPVSNSVRITPIKPGGKASRIRKGSVNDRNCATIIRYRSISESTRPCAKLVREARMPSTEPRTFTSTPLGILAPAISFEIPSAIPAQVLAMWANEDIYGTPDLVVVHLGGGLETGDLADHVEPCWPDQTRRTQRDRAEIQHALNLRFGVLNVQEIVVVIPRIDPDVGSYHLV